MCSTRPGRVRNPTCRSIFILWLCQRLTERPGVTTMLNDYSKQLPLIASIAGLAFLSATAGMASAAPQAMSTAAASCAGDSGGIVLSPGFCATVFADNIGHARHLVVSPSGVVYVNTWSGVYYNADPIPQGGFLIALKDSQGSGKADVVKRFGETAADGSAGGTGIALYQGSV